MVMYTCSNTLANYCRDSEPSLLKTGQIFTKEMQKVSPELKVSPQLIKTLKQVFELQVKPQSYTQKH